MIAEPVPHNSSDWENYILMMTKHKTLEKLEDSCSGAILTEGKMLNGKLDTKELSDWFKNCR